MIKIHCFGISREYAGGDEILLNQNSISVGSLRTLLREMYPKFSEFNRYMIAVNQEYAGDIEMISSSDEVAIIPPVSGG